MKTFIIKFVITASILLPSYSFAEGTGGMDMETYSIFFSYGFIVMVAVFFGYLIYCSTHPKTYIPKEITTAANFLQGAAGFEKIIPALNGVYYMVIVLMALYAVIFAAQLL